MSGYCSINIADGQIVIPPTQRDYNRLKYLKVSATIKKYTIMKLTFLSAILLQKHV
ncbi:hypothetical protein BN1088_1432295 [Sphingobacterium sp. PM2-P1-29]|nr:hypothetical protein BN1088_1432295 [Sphingobacterium sp. PM2-P1-29]